MADGIRIPIDLVPSPAQQKKLGQDISKALAGVKIKIDDGALKTEAARASKVLSDATRIKLKVVYGDTITKLNKAISTATTQRLKLTYSDVVGKLNKSLSSATTQNLKLNYISAVNDFSKRLNAATNVRLKVDYKSAVDEFATRVKNAANVKIKFNATEDIKRIRDSLRLVSRDVRIRFDLTTARSQIAFLESRLKALPALNVRFDRQAVRFAEESFRRQVEARFNAKPISVRVRFVTTSAGGIGELRKDGVKSLKELTDETKKASNAQKGLSDRLGLTFNRFAGYALIGGAILQIRRALSSATSQTIEYSKEVSNLTQILEGNRDAANRSVDFTIQTAQRLGQNALQLVKINTLLAQSGKQFETESDRQAAVEALARTPLVATFGTLDNTTQGIIASLNQFNLAGSETNRVLDIANSLSKKFAFEADNLFTAVQTGGAAFSVAGGQIEGFAATVTALRQLTRISAPTIGTGLNTIALRLLRPEVIEFTDSLTNNATRDAEGNLKSIEDRLLAIGQAFGTLTKEQQGIVIEQVAGIRQGKLLAPLLGDIGEFGDDSQFVRALNEARNSAGSLSRDVAISLDRIDVQLARIGANFSQVFKDLSENQGIKNLVKDFADIANFSASVAKSLGPLIPGLIRVGAAFALISGARFALRNIGQTQIGRAVSGTARSVTSLPSNFGAFFDARRAAEAQRLANRTNLARERRNFSELMERESKASLRLSSFPGESERLGRRTTEAIRQINAVRRGGILARSGSITIADAARSGIPEIQQEARNASAEARRRSGLSRLFTGFGFFGSARETINSRFGSRAVRSNLEGQIKSRISSGGVDLPEDPKLTKEIEKTARELAATRQNIAQSSVRLQAYNAALTAETAETRNLSIARKRVLFQMIRFGRSLAAAAPGVLAVGGIIAGTLISDRQRTLDLQGNRVGNFEERQRSNVAKEVTRGVLTSAGTAALLTPGGPIPKIITATIAGVFSSFSAGNRARLENDTETIGSASRRQAPREVGKEIAQVLTRDLSRIRDTEEFGAVSQRLQSQVRERTISLASSGVDPTQALQRAISSVLREVSVGVASTGELDPATALARVTEAFDTEIRKTSDNALKAAQKIETLNKAFQGGIRTIELYIESIEKETSRRSAATNVRSIATEFERSFLSSLSGTFGPLPIQQIQEEVSFALSQGIKSAVLSTDLSTQLVSLDDQIRSITVQRGTTQKEIETQKKLAESAAQTSAQLLALRERLETLSSATRNLKNLGIPALTGGTQGRDAFAQDSKERSRIVDEIARLEIILSSANARLNDSAGGLRQSKRIPTFEERNREDKILTDAETALRDRRSELVSSTRESVNRTLSPLGLESKQQAVVADIAIVQAFFRAIAPQIIATAANEAATAAVGDEERFRVSGTISKTLGPQVLNALDTDQGKALFNSIIAKLESIPVEELKKLNVEQFVDMVSDTSNAEGTLNRILEQRFKELQESIEKTRLSFEKMSEVTKRRNEIESAFNSVQLNRIAAFERIGTPTDGLIGQVNAIIGRSTFNQDSLEKASQRVVNANTRTSELTEGAKDFVDRRDILNRLQKDADDLSALPKRDEQQSLELKELQNQIVQYSIEQNALINLTQRQQEAQIESVSALAEYNDIVRKGSELIELNNRKFDLLSKSIDSVLRTNANITGLSRQDRRQTGRDLGLVNAIFSGGIGQAFGNEKGFLENFSNIGSDQLQGFITQIRDSRLSRDQVRGRVLQNLDVLGEERLSSGVRANDASQLIRTLFRFGQEIPGLEAPGGDPESLRQNIIEQIKLSQISTRIEELQLLALTDINSNIIKLLGDADSVSSLGNLPEVIRNSLSSTIQTNDVKNVPTSPTQNRGVTQTQTNNVRGQEKPRTEEDDRNVQKFGEVGVAFDSFTKVLTNLIKDKFGNNDGTQTAAGEAQRSSVDLTAKVEVSGLSNVSNTVAVVETVASFADRVSQLLNLSSPDQAEIKRALDSASKTIRESVNKTP